MGNEHTLENLLTWEDINNVIVIFKIPYDISNDYVKKRMFHHSTIFHSNAPCMVYAMRQRYWTWRSETNTFFVLCSTAIVLTLQKDRKQLKKNTFWGYRMTFLDYSQKQALIFYSVWHHLCMESFTAIKAGACNWLTEPALCALICSMALKVC